MSVFKQFPIPSFSATQASEADVVAALEKESFALITGGLGQLLETFGKRVVNKAHEHGIRAQLQEQSPWLVRQMLKCNKEFLVLRSSECVRPPKELEKWLVMAHQANRKIRIWAEREQALANRQNT